MNLNKESKENRINERIKKFIESDEAKIENLVVFYKFAKDIINFIIDDGFKEKYQRIYLFNHKFVYAGISCDINNKTFKVWIVYNYANEIEEESADIKNNINIYYEKIMGKENKSKNAFQNDDEPDKTISLKNFKLTKNIKDENRR